LIKSNGKILEKLEIINIARQLSEYEFKLPIIQRLYDKYKSIDVIKKQLKNDPYACLVNIKGVGFLTADKMILNVMPDKRESKERANASIVFAINQNEQNGHTMMGIQECYNKFLELTPECKDWFHEAIETGENIKLLKELEQVTTVSNYYFENSIYKKIMEMKDFNDDNVWDIDVKKYYDVGGLSLTEEQQSSLQMVCNNNISILNGSAGCVDKDTEYFNGEKWIKISEYKEGDMVLQYNKNRTANLTIPLKYIKKECDYFNVIKTQNGSINQWLCDEHDIVYLTSRNNIAKKNVLEMIKTHQNSPSGFTGKFINSFNYEGKGIDLTNEEIRLMVAVIADGSFKDNSNVCRVNIKKDRKKERLRAILKQAKIEWKEFKKDSGYSVFTFIPPMKVKKFDKYWYSANNTQMETILNEVFYWDGRIDEKGRTSFSTTEKESADYVQFIASCLDYYASVNIFDRVGQEYETCGKIYTRKSIEYSVHVSKRKGRKSSLKVRNSKTEIVKKLSPDGYKYCFTVESGMLVLRREGRIFITGNCGKSMTINAIVSMANNNNKKCLLLAPTGKASKVLSKYTDHEAFTIHRGLGYHPKEGWSYNSDLYLPYDIVILDEISMVDVNLMYRVLDAIDTQKTKLLLVGDNFQLPSVGQGNIATDLFTSEEIPITNLTKVFRYGDGGMFKIATDTRMGKNYLNDITKKTTTFGKDADYNFIYTNTDEEYYGYINHIYTNLLKKGVSIYDIAVLTGRKQGTLGTLMLNNHIQEEFNPNAKLGGKYLSYRSYGDETKFYKGDLVMQIVNNYDPTVYDELDFGYDDDFTTTNNFITNGETGIVSIVEDKYIVVDYKDLRIQYSKEELNQLILGYASTIHKKQGDAVPYAIVVNPKEHLYTTTRNLLYVGITRAKERVYHLSEPDIIKQALLKVENKQRKTLLPYFFQKVL
jgi:ATP-dependent exoDNAse (exonuclease V) alpha subunit